MSKYYKAEDIDNAIREAHAEAESNEIGEAMFHLHCVVSDLPTIEVSEDCISREWVKGICEYMLDEEMLGHMLGHIEDAPSVVPTVRKNRQVERAEGEWIYIDEPIIGNPYGRYRCSECELEEPHKTDYCPNCGARMKG